jgi:putative component of membrane protein insertase Oxa1/YidC/SpoIIIJ protein YidD
MNKIILLFILFFSLNLYSQTDWVKWGKADISYAKKVEYSTKDYSFVGDNFTETMIKSFISVYWFFISEVDGDNCPFRPSCSNFFIDAVEETNLVQGVLILFDRMSRDLNFFERKHKYVLYDKLHYYDPVDFYTLNANKIPNLPLKAIQNSE